LPQTKSLRTQYGDAVNLQRINMLTKIFEVLVYSIKAQQNSS